MAPAVVQSTSVNATGFPSTVTTPAFGSATTSGNAIVVCASASSSSADITSVTDSKSNTYVKIQAFAAGSIDIEVWMCQNITGGASHTVSSNDSGFVLGGLAAYEISGLPTSGNINDGIATTSGSGGTITATLGASTSNANDILIMCAAISNNSGTWSAGSLGGSTGINLKTFTGSSQSGSSETQVVSSTGTFSGTLSSTTTNQFNVGILVALSNTVLAASTPGPDKWKRKDVETTDAYRKAQIVMY